MARDGLEIFAEESEPASDPVVRRGIGAILGLAGILAVTILGIGAITAGAIVGLVWLVGSPKNVDEFSASTVGCVLVHGEVLVTVKLEHGADFRDRGDVFVYDWVPDVVHDLDPRTSFDDEIQLNALASQAADIHQLVVQFGRGEVASQQTFEVDIDVGASSCTVSIG
jgi:hypothetical protein